MTDRKQREKREPKTRCNTGRQNPSDLSLPAQLYLLKFLLPPKIVPPARH
jgi:hypothetical protein